VGSIAVPYDARWYGGHGRESLGSGPTATGGDRLSRCGGLLPCSWARDDSATLAGLKAHRQELFDPDDR